MWYKEPRPFHKIGATMTTVGRVSVDSSAADLASRVRRMRILSRLCLLSIAFSFAYVKHCADAGLKGQAVLSVMLVLGAVIVFVWSHARTIDLNKEEEGLRKRIRTATATTEE